MNDALNNIPVASEVKAEAPKSKKSPSVYRALAISVGVFTLLGGAACVTGALLYSRTAPPMLDTMHLTISELAMREAQRLEDAHAYDKAFAKYQAALAGRYQGPQNRAFTLYRLGMLQREQGLGAGLADYLEQAIEHPRCPLDAFEVYTHELMSEFTPEKESEVLQLFSRWELQIEAPDEYAMYYFYRGGYAQMKGQSEAAKVFWARGEGYVSGSPCAWALGEALYAEGSLELANHYNNTYLLKTRNTDFLIPALALALKLESM
jgi:hypothetical protein